MLYNLLVTRRIIDAIALFLDAPPQHMMLSQQHIMLLRQYVDAIAQHIGSSMLLVLVIENIQICTPHNKLATAMHVLDNCNIHLRFIKHAGFGSQSLKLKLRSHLSTG